jgi:hypothetical protein
MTFIAWCHREIRNPALNNNVEEFGQARQEYLILDDGPIVAKVTARG